MYCHDRAHPRFFPDMAAVVSSLTAKVDALSAADRPAIIQKAVVATVSKVQLALQLAIHPTPPSSPSVLSGSSEDTPKAIKRALLQRKLDVLRFYGLDGELPLSVDDPPLRGKPWTAFTMLSVPGAPPLPLQDCTLSHIWPAKRETEADVIAVNLKLDAMFYTSPRNFLVLPKVVEVAFDREAVIILLPNSTGDITVWPWRMDVLTETQRADLQNYLGKTLDWPFRGSATPCMPFMCLMAWKMLSQSLRPPPAELDPRMGSLADARARALSSSVSSEGNVALSILAEGMDFSDAIGGVSP